MSKEKNKTKKQLMDLCENFLVEKEKSDYFDKVIKKEFYKEIGEEFSEDDKLEIIDENNDTSNGYAITRVIKTKVNYNLEKLKAKLDADEYKNITYKKVEITNAYAFLKLLKNSGVKFSELKKCATIKDLVDEKKLEQDLEIGKVAKSDIISCISDTEYSEPYFLVKRLKDGKK